MRNVVAEVLQCSHFHVQQKAFGTFLGEQLPPEKENSWQLL